MKKVAANLLFFAFIGASPLASARPCNHLATLAAETCIGVALPVSRTKLATVPVVMLAHISGSSAAPENSIHGRADQNQERIDD